MARSMTSLGMDSALALATANRSREFMLGSGMPPLAATVISRESLENAFERAASARPLRCWMFLNLECPAIGFALGSGKGSRAFYPEARPLRNPRGLTEPQLWARVSGGG